jgi:hypothetical protein
MTRMRMLFLIAVAAICILAAWEYLNFTGFCYGQRRYLSNQEMIDAAVLYEINTNARYYVQDVRDNLAWTKKYASIAEFHKENPHCCTVWRWDFPGNYGEGIWVRVVECTLPVRQKKWGQVSRSRLIDDVGHRVCPGSP